MALAKADCRTFSELVNRFVDIHVLQALEQLYIKLIPCWNFAGLRNWRSARWVLIMEMNLWRLKEGRKRSFLPRYRVYSDGYPINTASQDLRSITSAGGYVDHVECDYFLAATGMQSRNAWVILTVLVGHRNPLVLQIITTLSQIASSLKWLTHPFLRRRSQRIHRLRYEPIFNQQAMGGSAFKITHSSIFHRPPPTLSIPPYLQFSARITVFVLYCHFNSPSSTEQAIPWRSWRTCLQRQCYSQCA